MTQNKLARAVGLSVNSPSSPYSLQLSLKNEKLEETQAAYVAPLQSADEASADIVGNIYAINAKDRGWRQAIITRLGQITRLKLVPRKMYGRGNIDLLLYGLIGVE